VSRFVCGFHSVLSELKHAPSGVKQIFLERTRDDHRARDVISLAQSREVRVLRVERSRLDGIAGEVRHQGVAAELRHGNVVTDLFEVVGEIEQRTLLLGLDGVQDPRNLGACIRVADAFGVSAVFAPKDRAAGMTSTVSKSASGATVPFVPVTNLARSLAGLRERGAKIVGASHDAHHDLLNADLDGPLVWVLGAEQKGLRRLTREHCDFLIRIPTTGSVASLNLAVACGICLFETHRRRLARTFP
jgi:23S rRNA (guanosine2251-2'-O)-methyltransferase